MSNDSAVSTLEKITSLIQEYVTPQQYRTWFQTLKISDISDDKICFSVSNDFLKEWICRYYREVLEKAIFSVLGRNAPFSISSESLSSASRDAHNDDSTFSTTTVLSPSSSPDSLPPSPHLNNKTRLSTKSDITLNPKYLFNNFIVGRGNELAYAASLAVADAPSRAYNPLFIHGSVGLGKTHLLQAICHERLQQDPHVKILYLSCETFINQFISSIEKGNIRHFRDKYRHNDILLIDDIYLIANKERTQEEFFHTFNALYNAGKQIVLSSDSPPSEIPTLEDRLVSRFKMGLVAQIDTPNFETRYAILRAKARAIGHKLPDDVLNYLAESIDTNIRELEGGITKVVGLSVLTKSPLTLSLAHTAMRDVNNKPRTYITIDDIVRAVTTKFTVKLSDLQSKKRTHSIALPRQVCMYIAKKETTLSLKEIGGYFGGRDHTTVIYAHDKIAKEMEKNENISRIINDILNHLHA